MKATIEGTYTVWREQDSGRNSLSPVHRALQPRTPQNVTPRLIILCVIQRERGGRGSSKLRYGFVPLMNQPWDSTESPFTCLYVIIAKKFLPRVYLQAVYHPLFHSFFIPSASLIINRKDLVALVVQDLAFSQRFR